MVPGCARGGLSAAVAAAVLAASACGAADETATAVDAGVEAAAECDAAALDWGRGGPVMLPGTDCLRCHLDSGRAKLVLAAAGTVFSGPDCPAGVEGATVRLWDDVGRSLDLVSNEVGNFYTSEPLVPPLRAAVDLQGVVAEMREPTISGSCGACHAAGSAVGFVTPGR
ncbi:MAG: hypothetical protein HY744_09900 [Deltaproteobacteria bacterium]|nr:hypothetical protein [Deltaproteobacteria bacterium]